MPAPFFCLARGKKTFKHIVNPIFFITFRLCFSAHCYKRTN